MRRAELYPSPSRTLLPWRRSRGTTPPESTLAEAVPRPRRDLCVGETTRALTSARERRQHWRTSSATSGPRVIRLEQTPAHTAHIPTPVERPIATPQPLGKTCGPPGRGEPCESSGTADADEAAAVEEVQGLAGGDAPFAHRAALPVQRAVEGHRAHPSRRHPIPGSTAGAFFGGPDSSTRCYRAGGGPTTTSLLAGDFPGAASARATSRSSGLARLGSVSPSCGGKGSAFKKLDAMRNESKACRCPDGGDRGGEKRHARAIPDEREGRRSENLAELVTPRPRSARRRARRSPARRSTR